MTSQLEELFQDIRDAAQVERVGSVPASAGAASPDGVDESVGPEPALTEQSQPTSSSEPIPMTPTPRIRRDLTLQCLEALHGLTRAIEAQVAAIETHAREVRDQNAEVRKVLKRQEQFADMLALILKEAEEQSSQEPHQGAHQAPDPAPTYSQLERDLEELARVLTTDLYMRNQHCDVQFLDQRANSSFGPQLDSVPDEQIYSSFKRGVEAARYFYFGSSDTSEASMFDELLIDINNRLKSPNAKSWSPRTDSDSPSSEPSKPAHPAPPPADPTPPPAQTVEGTVVSSATVGAPAGTPAPAPNDGAQLSDDEKETFDIVANIAESKARNGESAAQIIAGILKGPYGGKLPRKALREAISTGNARVHPA